MLFMMMEVVVVVVMMTLVLVTRKAKVRKRKMKMLMLPREMLFPVLMSLLSAQLLWRPSSGLKVFVVAENGLHCDILTVQSISFKDFLHFWRFWLPPNPQVCDVSCDFSRQNLWPFHLYIWGLVIFKEGNRLCIPLVMVILLTPYKAHIQVVTTMQSCRLNMRCSKQAL